MTDEKRERLCAKPQENRLHRARRFVQAVQSDLTGDQHILMLDSVIDDIQAVLAQSNAEPMRDVFKPMGRPVEYTTPLMPGAFPSPKAWETKAAQSDAEQETLSDYSLGLAAQAWCEPETSHKVMDEELCKAFARILERALTRSEAAEWQTKAAEWLEQRALTCSIRAAPSARLWADALRREAL